MEQFDYEQFKKKLNKKIKIPISIILVLIIIFSFILMILTSSYKKTTVYFVEIGNFQSYRYAKKQTESLKGNDIYAYIFYNETYHVFLDFYNSKKEAAAAKEKAKFEYKNVNVFELDIKRIPYQKNLTKAQNSYITKAENKIDEIIQCFYTFNKEKNSSLEKLKVKIESLSSEFELIVNEFKDLFKGDALFNIPIKYLIKIITTLNELKNKEEIALSLHYALCDIVVENYYFCLCF